MRTIEISPFGLDWPDLDEDLSFHGLLEGNHGQFQKKVKVRPGAASRQSGRGGAGKMLI
jgi:hypothetical protein